VVVVERVPGLRPPEREDAEHAAFTRDREVEHGPGAEPAHEPLGDQRAGGRVLDVERPAGGYGAAERRRLLGYVDLDVTQVLARADTGDPTEHGGARLVGEQDAGAVDTEQVRAEPGGESGGLADVRRGQQEDHGPVDPLAGLVLLAQPGGDQADDAAQDGVQPQPEGQLQEVVLLPAQRRDEQRELELDAEPQRGACAAGDAGVAEDQGQRDEVLQQLTGAETHAQDQRDTAGCHHCRAGPVGQLAPGQQGQRDRADDGQHRDGRPRLVVRRRQAGPHREAVQACHGPGGASQVAAQHPGRARSVAVLEQDAGDRHRGQAGAPAGRHSP
jgi:hypothetical protein